jgi:hypothetical protein
MSVSIRGGLCATSSQGGRRGIGAPPSGQIQSKHASGIQGKDARHGKSAAALRLPADRASFQCARPRSGCGTPRWWSHSPVGLRRRWLARGPAARDIFDAAAALESELRPGPLGADHVPRANPSAGLERAGACRGVPCRLAASARGPRRGASPRDAGAPKPGTPRPGPLSRSIAARLVSRGLPRARPRSSRARLRWPAVLPR